MFWLDASQDNRGGVACGKTRGAAGRLYLKSRALSISMRIEIYGLGYGSSS
jgi:hypothetical protein